MFGFLIKKRRPADLSALLAHDTITINGQKLDVHELPSADRQRFQEKLQSQDGQFDSFAYLVSVGCVQFRGQTPDEIRAAVSDLALSKIGVKIMQLCGLGAVDDKKKSGPTSDDSSSD